MHPHLQKKMYIYYIFAHEPAKHCKHDQQLIGLNPGCCKLILWFLVPTEVGDFQIESWKKCQWIKRVVINALVFHW